MDKKDKAVHGLILFLTYVLDELVGPTKGKKDKPKPGKKKPEPEPDDELETEPDDLDNDGMPGDDIDDELLDDDADDAHQEQRDTVRKLLTKLAKKTKSNKKPLAILKKFGAADVDAIDADKLDAVIKFIKKHLK